MRGLAAAAIAAALSVLCLTAAPALAAPPANDDFPGQNLGSEPTASASGTNVEATKEADEPNHAGDAGGASVWYSWTAPADGATAVDLCGSNFDTLLAVYTGNAVNGLGLPAVAANDDACALQSRLTFIASAGTTYRIAVDGYRGGSSAPQQGSIELELTQAEGDSPSNDDFPGQNLGSTLPASASGTNLNATKQPGEPTHAGNAGGASVWYSWTAPADGVASVDLCGSNFDTLLAVYTGNAVNGLNLPAVAANDNACGTGSRVASRVAFMATMGTVYRIAVDGRNGLVGSFELQITLDAPDTVVTNADDAGGGSLRHAINSANLLPGPDTISFAPGVSGTIELASVLPALSDDVEIQGPGADRLTVLRNPEAPEFRILGVNANVTAVVSGMTLSGGRDSNGGGVSTRGHLTIRDSTITGNTATSYGGGIALEPGGTMTIEGSTISDNTAGNPIAGGGIDNAGELTIRSSTITDNAASGDRSGGGIWSNGSLIVVGSTIAGNANPTGAGNLRRDSGSVSLKSTIIADPLGGHQSCTGGTGTSTSGHNLAGDASCGLDSATDQTGVNPQLEPLADNGGPTETMALADTSPALDQGHAGSLSSDQRGEQRPVDLPEISDAADGDGADVGAFELAAAPPPAPTVAITGGPEGLTSERRPSFSFDAEHAASLECSIDAGPADYGPCSSSSAHTPGADLEDGEHTFRVRATGEAGEPAIATRLFTVDGTPPTVSISGGPQGPTNDRRPSFEFDAEPGATVSCSVDTGAAAFGPCSDGSGHRPPANLGEAAYTFRVRATDEAGNQATATRPFTVDTTPPSLAITSGPSGPTNDRRPSFGFAAETGATLSCSIDTGTAAFEECSSASAHTPGEALPDGDHTFRVRALDSAGNQTTRTRTFTVDSAEVDATPPDTSITAAPPASTQETTARFEFTATEPGSSFECKLDGAPFAACASPQSYSALEPGSHSFRVRAIDQAGNVDPTPAERGWTVTASEPPPPPPAAPETEIAKLKVIAAKRIARVAFTGSGGSGALSFQCKLDGKAFKPCASPLKLKRLKPGKHLFAVRAVDATGKRDPTPAKKRFKV